MEEMSTKISFTNNWKFDGFNWQDITILHVSWQFDEYYQGIEVEIFNFVIYIWRN